MNISAYWRLMRFHKPVGLWLLWFPTAWALWASSEGNPSLKCLLLFFVGTVTMRAAGCVINDIADRHFDKQVVRTQARPLASGEIGLLPCFCLLFVLLCIALFLVLQLPKDCFYLAMLGVLVTVIYPLCKRFFHAPQLVLGLAFSMGMPMAYVASGKPFDSALGLLLAINFLWTVSYDTIYAMADKADDGRIGVQSLALYLADYDKVFVALVHVTLQGLWILWGVFAHCGIIFYLFWGLAGCVLVYQHTLIRTGDSALCFKAFVMNAYYAALMSIALVS